jgi:probable rRNA maturation factor
MIRVDATRRRGVADLVPTRQVQALVAAAASAAGAPADASVAVTLTDDRELAELNATHMGRDGPTDVLSFPLLPPPAFPAHPGQDPTVRASADGVAFVLPPGEPVHLGDIVVSVERAVAQAADGHGGQTGDVRWSAQDELRLLLVHGTLHLCGWDHAEPVEESAMRALERELLTRSGSGQTG